MTHFTIYRTRAILTVLSALSSLFVISCKNIIDIPAPTNTIVTEQAFMDDFNANGAIAGIYSRLARKQEPTSFGNGWVTYYLGASSDELVPFLMDAEQRAFYTNNLTDRVSALTIPFNQSYAIIYQCNSALEQIEKSSGLTPAAKARFKGEALFVRSFCYYYLVGIWGDVPFVTTTEWSENIAVAKSNKDQILRQLSSDLKEATNLLPSDYSLYKGERIRATKWASLALLSKVAAELGVWSDVEFATSEVLSSNLFQLSVDLNDVFLINSSESILQLYNQREVSPFNLVTEAAFFTPFNRTSPPRYYIGNDILSSISSTDKRRAAWLDSTVYLGNVYYYSKKYKGGPAQLDPSAPSKEYYMLLRLAELYLLRAESFLKQGQLEKALIDLNTIRNRAGIGPVETQSPVEIANWILEESKREFFIEWGKRWFDLRRTGAIDSVMAKSTAEKGGNWATFRRYFPIGQQELLTNPLLEQTSGY